MKRSVLVWSCCAALLGSACDGGNTGEPGTPDGGGTSDGGGTPDGGGPTGPSVTGTVIPGASTAGRTLSVLIPGGGRQPVNVDASGAFRIPNVTPPYDLIIADKAQHSAVVYQGLTLSSPTVFFDADTAVGSAHTGYVEGHATAGASSTPSLVAFVSATGAHSIDSDNGGSYSLSVNWDGASTTTGTLYAFQAERSSPFFPPTRYVAAGQRDNVTLTANTSLSGQDVALSTVTNSSLVGGVTLPTNYVVSYVSVGLVPRPGGTINLFTDISGKSTFNYAVPQLAGATFSLNVFAREDNKSAPDDSGGALLVKRGLSAGATNVSLAVPTAPRLAQPAQDATGVALSTVFSWSAFTGGVHQLQFQQDRSETPTPYSLRILTRAVQTSLPDLSPLGITLPAKTRLSWQVNGLGPVTSVDALVGLLVQGDPLTQGTGDFSSGTSASRAFTTAAAP